jgi:hypothetical protein
VDKHRCGSGVSDLQAEAAAAAIQHLNSLGTPGLLDAETCKALRRNGFTALAADVYARSKGLAA